MIRGFSCGAKVGSIVVAYGKSYEVVEINDHGFYVCRNLDENCSYSNEIKDFDDLDIDHVLSPNDPRFVSFGEGI